MNVCVDTGVGTVGGDTRGPGMHAGGGEGRQYDGWWWVSRGRCGDGGGCGEGEGRPTHPFIRSLHLFMLVSVSPSFLHNLPHRHVVIHMRTRCHCRQTAPYVNRSWQLPRSGAAGTRLAPSHSHRTSCAEGRRTLADVSNAGAACVDTCVMTTLHRSLLCWCVRRTTRTIGGHLHLTLHARRGGAHTSHATACTHACVHGAAVHGVTPPKHTVHGCVVVTLRYLLDDPPHPTSRTWTRTVL